MKNTKNILPNTVLPKGAKLIKPTRRAVGHYAASQVNAEVTLLGVTWFRVMGGFSASKDREDWVADLPIVGPSVSDYCWREPRWGVRQYNSFEEATTSELRDALTNAQAKRGQTASALVDLDRVIERLSASLA